MNQTYEKVEKYINRYQMLQEGDTVVLGLSGGADSVCLLFMLMEYIKKVPCKLIAVHVHHGIRQEADKDAEYARHLCETHHIPFYLVKKDIPSIAEAERFSWEEAGRSIRYEAFYQVLQENLCIRKQTDKKKDGKEDKGEDRQEASPLSILEDTCSSQEEMAIQGGKIAVAHHQDDNAETVLWNLFRGSSIKGLGGIVPVRGSIIRPLLCLSRQEIEAFLGERGITYCIDATNQSDAYTRNKIRHHIVAYANENIVTGAGRHIAGTAEEMQEVENFLREQTRKAYETCVEEIPQIDYTNQYLLQKNTFLLLDILLQKRIIYYVLGNLAGTRKDVNKVHIEAIRDLMENQTGRTLVLPYGMEAKRTYEGVLLRMRKPVGQEKEKEEYVLPVEPGTSFCIPHRGRLEAVVFPYEESQVIPEKTYTKWFDYDKIEKSLELRHRRAGDYLTINDTNDKKSIKSFFVDKKIPQEERDHILLLADGSHIVWVIGYRISQYYKVTNTTHHIIQIKLEEDA